MPGFARSGPPGEPVGLDRRRLLGGAAALAGSAALWSARPRSARAAASPLSPTEVRFDQLDGVPLCYWRWKDGTAGKRVERMAFASTRAFHDRLVVWVQDLKAIAAQYGGLTGMDRIITAGTYVNKPLEHGKGQAFDLDQVRWKQAAVTPYYEEHAATDVRVRRRYLAVDAVCRRHFHWVLDGRYNADHADHLHLDTAGGTLVLDCTARSDTAFVQQVVNTFAGGNLVIDGSWGAITQRAFERTLPRLGVTGNPYGTPAVWQHWCLRVAACGFAGVPFDRAPADVADPLEALIEPIVGPVQHAVEELLGLLR